MKIKTRFAPSPTGKLHIGNYRTALINYLYAKKYNGSFILRIDDTDTARSTKDYEISIKNELSHLGLVAEEIFHQSQRLDKYEKVKNKLIEMGRLYECFETPEELDVKRKFLLASGKPPIYDRAGLNLTDQEKEKYRKTRRPHFRFKLNNQKISWIDLVKGEVKFHAENLSDPILIREDGSMTYMLCSTFDDIEMGITHVIRGEDHVSNTAIQMQLFDALGAKAPNFGHLSLVKSKEDKISKRTGGYDLESLRKNKCIEPMTINSFFANIGSSLAVIAYTNMNELIDNFDITKFSQSPTIYLETELDTLNHKLLIKLKFNQVKDRLKEMGLEEVDEYFWETIKPNINTLKDSKIWWNICYNPETFKADQEDKEFLKLAINLLPEGTINEDSWKIWTDKLKQATQRKGKKLYMPLRLAITGINSGPELHNLLPLIGREKIIARLKNSVN